MSNRGTWAEDAAAASLVKRSLKLLERNYRCRFGESDPVLRDARTLIFVEVRYRKSHSFGGAGESITTSKRRKLLRAARHYMAAHSEFPACRFDAVLLNGDTPEVDWIVDAFGE
jgi:putative endonuclease